MNIFILGNDPRELEILQKSLDGKKNSVTLVSASADVLRAAQTGSLRILIADLDGGDMDQTGLLQRLRALPSAEPVYILLITARGFEEGSLPAGVDDILRRPFTTAELKNRVQIAERIISLTSNLALAREQLESRAAFDPLTLFMNRAGFLRQAAGELERSRRTSLPLSLIALNIDDFKTINDRFGSGVGDDVLKAVAKTIREKSRPYDCIGRWTGDEFVLALPGVIGADAEKVSERIIAGVRGTRIQVQNEPPLNVKISAGVASIMRIKATTEVEPIIQNARQAVTRAKEAGGNQVFLVFL